MQDFVWGGHFGFDTTPAGEGLLLDPFGVLIQPGNILHVVRRALEGPTLAGYKSPDASRLVDWAALSREIERIRSFSTFAGWRSACSSGHGSCGASKTS